MSAIEIGKTYGGFKVLEIAGRKPLRYTVECVNCGAHFERITETIKMNRHGCAACYQKQRQERYKKAAEKETGKKYGTLMVVRVYRKAQPSSPKKTNYFALCRCDCGAEAEYQLSEVIALAVRCKACGGEKRPTSESITERKGKYYLIKSHNGRRYYFGTYDSLDEAEKVRDLADLMKKEGVFDEWYNKKFKDK